MNTYDLTVNLTTGYILIQNVPIISLKLLGGYILGGLASMFGYIQECLKREDPITAKGLFASLITGLFTIYMCVGFISIISPTWDAEKPYVLFILGYCARWISSFIEKKAELIVNGLLSKGVEKLGVSVDKEEDKEDSETKQ